jgi:hypothetical protein
MSSTSRSRDEHLSVESCATANPALTNRGLPTYCRVQLPLNLAWVSAAAHSTRCWKRLLRRKDPRPCPQWHLDGRRSSGGWLLGTAATRAPNRRQRPTRRSVCFVQWHRRRTRSLSQESRASRETSPDWQCMLQIKVPCRFSRSSRALSLAPGSSASRSIPTQMQHAQACIASPPKSTAYLRRARGRGARRGRDVQETEEGLNDCVCVFGYQIV